MILLTTDPQVRLRPWTTGDYESLVHYANNRAVWRNLTDLFPHPYTHRDAVEWVRIANEPAPGIHLAIEFREEAIGGIGVIACSGTGHHTGQFGYWLGEPHGGKGMATLCARTLRDYAFSSGRFRRLEASVFAWNPASMRVLEKVGFVRERVLRNNAFKDGELIDTVIYAANTGS